MATENPKPIKIANDIIVFLIVTVKNNLFWELWKKKV